MKTKQCTKCNEIKSLSEFNFNKKLKDGRGNTCKFCYNIYQKKINGTEEKKLKRKKITFENKEKNKLYRIQNKEKIAINKKIWKLNNHEIYSAYHKRISKFHIENLTDLYIISLLKSKINKSKLIEIPQELIELKRIQLKTFRLCQQLKN